MGSDINQSSFNARLVLSRLCVSSLITVFGDFWFFMVMAEDFAVVWAWVPGVSSGLNYETPPFLSGVRMFTESPLLTCFLFLISEL